MCRPLMGQPFSLTLLAIRCEFATRRIFVEHSGANR